MIKLLLFFKSSKFHVFDITYIYNLCPLSYANVYKNENK